MPSLHRIGEVGWMNNLPNLSKEDMEELGEAIKETLVEMKESQMYNQEFIHFNTVNAEIRPHGTSRIVIIIDENLDTNSDDNRRSE